MKQRDLFDPQMELMDQLIDQKEPLWVEPQCPTMRTAIARNRRRDYNRERLRKVRRAYFDHEAQGKAEKNTRLQDIIIQELNTNQP